MTKVKAERQFCRTKPFCFEYDFRVKLCDATMKQCPPNDGCQKPYYIQQLLTRFPNLSFKYSLLKKIITVTIAVSGTSKTTYTAKVNACRRFNERGSIHDIFRRSKGVYQFALEFIFFNTAYLPGCFITIYKGLNARLQRRFVFSRLTICIKHHN